MNKKARVTLKDIALKTGYTVNTVSHALKDKDDISPETRKKIQREAKKMGYINNILAGSLRSGITKTIAIILADISNPIFSIRVKEIDRVLHRYHYNTIIINTDEDSELEYNAVMSAIGRKADGIIICPTQKDKRIFSLMRKHNVPFVLLGRRFGKDDKMSSVVWNDENGGYLATKHLISLGKERILFLNGPTFISSSQERCEGYLRALNENSLQADLQLIVNMDIATHSVMDILSKIMQNDIRFDAIFAFSDFIAWEAIGTLKELGKDVPRDIPIVGFDDIQSHLKIPLPITSIGADKTAEAEAAVSILLDHIEGRAGNKVYCEIIDTMLVKREST